jgi:oligosaccharide repeat unit polymerase
MMKHFGLFFLCFWWLSWLLLSLSSVGPMRSPSLEVAMLYIGSFMFIILGYIFITKLGYKKYTNKVIFQPSIDIKHIKHNLTFITFFSLFCVLLALKFVGAFDSSFREYFIQIRGSGREAGSLVSGIGLIDYGLATILYPFAITVNLIIFSNPDGIIFKRLFFINFLFILCYAYFFQVNYPLLFLFIIVFYSQFNPYLSKSNLKSFRKKSIYPMFLLCVLVIAAAFNRFGSVDLEGVFIHYFVSYHTIGFAFFDYYYYQSDSLLQNHSFGLSFLGTFDFTVAYFLNFLGIDYSSALTQNVIHNSNTINLGNSGALKLTNAFGTYMFTFYRDFSYVGIVAYSFIYGASLAITNKKAHRGDRFSYALYLYLISMGTIAIYVSPLDFAYFWVVPLFLVFTKYKFKFKNRK